MADRLEKDALGQMRVPEEAYYGIATARALENFPISGLRAHPAFVDGFCLLKKACAKVNGELGLLDRKISEAIQRAAEEVLNGQLRDQFVVDVFQMGAGTSFHMNVNEVLANRAIEILGGKRGDYARCHPNDHVNFGQSTNDAFPTAMRIAGRMLCGRLRVRLTELAEALRRKAKEFDGILKAGRTHLQDAVPVRLGQEFAGYAAAVEKSRAALEQAQAYLEELGIGGSAAGTGLNTHPDYRGRVVKYLAEWTKIPFRPSPDLREAMQSNLPIAVVSAALRNLALELIRIANDFRLLCSGPTTGLDEIRLPAVQPGSSIMPGKVNPSMAEMLDMVCFQVVGNDTAIGLAVQAGQLELNVMMPVMAFGLHFSLEILSNAVGQFTRRCVEGIRANEERCRRYAESTPAIATALNPHIGYAKAAEIVKEAMATGKTIVEVAREKNVLPEEKLRKILDFRRMTEPGLPGS